VRHPGAVAVVALTEEGQICLVRQYRTALGRVTVEIPAGKLAPGEDPLACAERELKEETGFTAQKMAYLTTIATSAGFADELIHIYMATGLKLAESSPDADEFINVDLVDVGELVDAVLDGRIEDAKTVVGALICDAVSRRLDPGPVPEDQQQRQRREEGVLRHSLSIRRAERKAERVEAKAARPKKRNLMRSFLSYYKGQVHLFVGDIICALLVAGIDLAFPQILRVLTEGALHGRPGRYPLSPLGNSSWPRRDVCRALCLPLLRDLLGHVMGARMESKMREDLFDAYERMSFSYFDRHKSGDLMSRLVSDLFDISETAHHGPEFLLIGAVEIIGSFAILAGINGELTAVLAVVWRSLSSSTSSRTAAWRQSSSRTASASRV
jgi:8-oxo-dGTP pyrophosphatase MutT (NUDIX family)